MAQANSLAQLLPTDADRVLWVREPGLTPEVLAEYAGLLDGACPGRWDLLELEGGEALKRWDAMPHLFDAFQAHGLTRSSLVLTHGGGALSDAVGLAAALWKRGVRIAHMPTTTLAMVDAAWGGKTGINWRGSKNQLGTFTLPEFVHLDARWLVTLPDRERRAGLAEVAKHAMLHAHLGQAQLDRHARGLDSETREVGPIQNVRGRCRFARARRPRPAQLGAHRRPRRRSPFRRNSPSLAARRSGGLGVEARAVPSHGQFARGLPVFGPLARVPSASSQHALGAMA